jgi:hypothetical protein
MYTMTAQTVAQPIVEHFDEWKAIVGTPLSSCYFEVVPFTCSKRNLTSYVIQLEVGWRRAANASAKMMLLLLFTEQISCSTFHRNNV